MKKFRKIMVFILLLAITVAGVLASPVLGIVAAAGSLIGATITLTKMPTKGEVNKEIYIPAGTSNDGAVKVSVTDPRGNKVELGEPVDHNGVQCYKLEPKMIGDYKVQYSTEASASHNATKSEVYKISVSGSKATLTFEDNTPFILPEKVGKDSALVLPYPKVSETGSEDDAVMGKHENVTITAKTPNHEALTLETKEIDGETYSVFKPAKNAEGETVYGTYAITYSYTNTQGIKVSKSYKINVSSNYSTEDQKITFTWSGSMPTSAVLGKEVELPKPVTVDSNSNNSSVATYTKVTVKYVKGEEETAVDVDSQKFTFTPMLEAKSGARYIINYDIYTLEDLNLSNMSSTNFEEYLKTVTPTLSRTYSLDNVTDSIAPVPTAVKDYEVTDGVVAEDMDDEDISYTIPTKARVDVDITIPAIYATDNYDEFNKLDLTRSIINEDKSTIASLDTAGEPETKELTALNYTTAKTNQSATVRFKQKGTYTIRYQAKDSSGNRKEISYKIVVMDTFADDVAPFITMPTLPSSTQPGETISFSAPKVVDYSKDHKKNPTDTSTDDNNVKTNVMFFYGEWDSSWDTLTATELDAKLTEKNAEKIAKDKDDETTYKFDVNAETSATALTVVVRTEDDARYSTGRTENHVSFEHRTIKIKNTNDSSAPALVGNAETILGTLRNTLNPAEAYGQNAEVTIPSLDFSDGDNTGYLTTSLMVLDKNGNEVEVSGITYNYDGTKLTMQNGKFVTTVAGEYMVVITATDIGGNSVIYSVPMNVKDTKAPTIEIDELKTTIEVGEKYILPSPVVVDDGEVIPNHSKMQVVMVGDNPSYKLVQETLEFTPLKKGTYSFKYVASDGVNTTESAVYTITATDTTKPVIELSDIVEPTLEKDAEIELPSFSATDANGIRSTSLTVKDPDGDVVSPVEGTEYKFKFTRDGVYTVEYKAVDLADNETVETYTINVGDCTEPTITLIKENNPRQNGYKIGDTLAIKLSGITVKDNKYNNGEAYDVESAIRDGKIIITLTKPDGSKVTFPQDNSNYTFKFETAGSYTLTYQAKDDAGNTATKQYTFEVKAETDNKSVSEQAWGIVLIVVSLALLCGVVIYFVKTKDVSSRDDKAKEKAKENAKKLSDK